MHLCSCRLLSRLGLTSQNTLLCVVGSTSSGKSTLLNALLGEDILLTDHNAATAVLCKVKHSEDDKFALVHFEGDQERERLDLHSNTGRQQLESYIKRDRTEPRSETRTCSFVEIFWPKEFLKVGNFDIVN